MGGEVRRGEIMKGHKETFQVTNIFTALIVVMVSQVNIDFKLSNYTHSIHAV